MSAPFDVGLKFHVRWPSGKVDSLLVDASSALIGTAGHCEVRLPMGVGSHEHVEIFVTDGAVHLTTRADAAPPLLDGAPFASGVWPRGSVLSIGNISMTVEPVDLRGNVKRRSPFWALLPVPLIAATVLFARSSTVAENKPPPAPPLFDDPIATCPNPNSPTLPTYAAERARIGYAMRERSPFSRNDGIEAVKHFETAAACFRTANLPDEARETLGAAQALRHKLDEEYHTRRIRLEHAAKVNDPITARRELMSLRPLTAHREGKYADWLAAMDRWAATEIAEREGKKLH